jgi:hypothetical protein
MPAKPKVEEPTISLGAEARRRRVAEVRSLDRELEQVQNALLDAQARLPGLIDRVARARAVIDANTAPKSPDDEGSD